LIAILSENENVEGGAAKAGLIPVRMDLCLQSSSLDGFKWPIPAVCPVVQCDITHIEHRQNQKYSRFFLTSKN